MGSGVVGLYGPVAEDLLRKKTGAGTYTHRFGVNKALATRILLSHT